MCQPHLGCSQKLKLKISFFVFFLLLWDDRMFTFLFYICPSSSPCPQGSSADSHLLRLHHHRRSDGSRHHSGSHPHHHLLHGGDQTQLLRGLLVHASSVHHLLRRSGLPRSRVRVTVTGLLRFLLPVLLLTPCVSAHKAYREKSAE